MWPKPQANTGATSFGTAQDAGPHPNPAKATDGKRLHRLEPDSATAPVVQRIFTDYLAGRGLFAIAEALTRDDVPSPSAYDRARNPHRCGIAWSKGAVRVILSNPRYTGRQVWNKQRKDEVLLDVDDVALGHTSTMRWNHQDAWVWSTEIVHQPLIDTEAFEQVQAMLTGRGAQRSTRERHRTQHRYVLRGLLHCGLCGRRMQGQQSKQALYYRCRFPTEYGLANKITHPRNVYLAERELIGPLEEWLATSFAPHRVADTIHAMYAAQPDIDADPAVLAAGRVVQECDQKLARYRKALEAGTDPTLIARWTAEVQAQRAEALARSRKGSGRDRMTKQEIQALVDALGNIATVLAQADPTDKAEVYRQLGLRLTYQPAEHLVRAEAHLDPHGWGYGLCPRGDSTTTHTPSTSTNCWWWGRRQRSHPSMGCHRTGTGTRG
ncbi:MAG TPA: recombinase family protein [Pseudonocardiaceae bacterium]|nr:recombinase family protein [Pseudonocardiaceae bacterium]